MRANLSGFVVALASLAVLGWRGWPLNTSTSGLPGRSVFVVFHVHYLLFYLLVSVVAGFGAAWLVRRLPPTSRVA